MAGREHDRCPFQRPRTKAARITNLTSIYAAGQIAYLRLICARWQDLRTQRKIATTAAAIAPPPQSSGEDATSSTKSRPPQLRTVAKASGGRCLCFMTYATSSSTVSLDKLLLNHWRPFLRQCTVAPLRGHTSQFVLRTQSSPRAVLPQLLVINLRRA